MRVWGLDSYYDAISLGMLPPFASLLRLLITKFSFYSDAAGTPELAIPSADYFVNFDSDIMNVLPS